MDQADFTSLYCAKPENFAWFLGAGASRTAGLPTASDIIWDLKRRHYCSQENQDISRQDIQNDAVRTRIQSFMESKGFPKEWAEHEYTTYFDKIFGADLERQRKYLRAILSEEHVKLSVGNRVLGGLIGAGRTRIIFTTNFDSIVEKAVAEVSGKSLASYHLEGSHSAVQALNNEEFPIYCKLHGDFRHDSLKNLATDLAQQNAALSQALVNAANRFGFVVTGYSGRDASVMSLFRSALASGNPFPHGLYWTGIKGSPLHPAVEDLLKEAATRGVHAEHVPIETFDAFMLRLWRNLGGKDPAMESQVRKGRLTTVQIPLPSAGQSKPLVRMNALPVLTLPGQCLSPSFNGSKDWSELQRYRDSARGEILLTRSDRVLCWGTVQRIHELFGNDLLDLQPYDLPLNLASPENRQVKGFVEEALCAALSRNKPLLYRTTSAASFLIVNPHAESKAGLAALSSVLGNLSGIVPDLTAPPSAENGSTEKVDWAEALRVSLDVRNGHIWLLANPDIWIWPRRARRVATEFMDERRSDRFNKRHNELLDAWIQVILGTTERNAEITVSAFDDGEPAENPIFTIGSRTAFTRRLTS